MSTNLADPDPISLEEDVQLDSPFELQIRAFRVRMHREDVVLSLMVIVYILLVLSFHALNGSNEQIKIYFFSPVLTAIAAGVSFVFLSAKRFRGLSVPYLSQESILGFVSILLLSSGFKTAFASHKQTIQKIVPFYLDEYFSDIDRIIHLGSYPHEYLTGLFRHEQLIRLFDLYYMLWFAFLICSCILAAWSKRRILRFRFLFSMILIWSFIGTFSGTLLSSAGPCYYDKLLSSLDHKRDNPYQPLMEKLYEVDKRAPLFAVRNQTGLWENEKSGGWLPFGGISAMPSVHVGVAVLFALTALKISRLLGYFFLFYAIMIQIGSVILAWHYAIDGYVAILLTLIIWALSQRAAEVTFASRFRTDS